MAASVGGLTAARADLTERVADRLVPFDVGVETLSFLLIMIAYRSLVIPLKAAALNLLSIGAAYGIVVMVFQWGWGASLIGLDGPVPIESFVPMMMFAVLFGLSMDYEVFLLTSFREHWERSGDVAVAVRRALADTGQVITSAALIMVGVFASFILADQTIAKMFGVGLAAAVAIDASLVRCVLVPSIMVLAAKRTFWLPGWLDRLLPRVNVEGDPATLASIHEPPATPDRDPARPSVGVLAAVAAVLVAWFVGTRLLPAGPDGAGMDIAVAVAAVAGAVAAWLPWGLPGAGRSMGVRVVVLLAGVATTGIAFAVARSLVPPAELSVPPLVGLALLATTAVSLLPGLRRYGLVFVAGGFAVAAGLGVAPPAADPVAVMTTSAVAAVIAMLVAVTVDAVVRPRPEPRGGRPAVVEEPAPRREGELVGR
jgi:RND superfamily putative drug exporter